MGWPAGPSGSRPQRGGGGLRGRSPVRGGSFLFFFVFFYYFSFISLLFSFKVSINFFL